ncbi:hypothetical protein A6R68_16037, partial [Neotoma lepida]
FLCSDILPISIVRSFLSSHLPFSYIEDLWSCYTVDSSVLRSHHQVMMKMKTKNITHVSEFYLLRVSDDPELQPVLCGFFLSILGNLLIFLTVSSDSHLHTPMYFFLSILSLTDISFISTTVPNMVCRPSNPQYSHILYGLSDSDVSFCHFCMFFSLFWKNVVASLMYTVVTPMLNPFICSLRNQDISSSLKRLP